MRLPPLPATWPSQRPVGSEAGGGLGCANGSPLPAILLPCLSHLCPPPPSPSITIPLPGPGESDGSRRPPPRGGGGARGRLLARGSEAVSPPPPPGPAAPPTPPPLRRRAAHGWRRELQRCVCEGGGCAWSSMSGGCVLFQGHSWGGGSLATVQGSSWGRELSSVEPRAGEHCPWGAARSEGRGSRREALSNAGPLGAYTGGGGTLCQGLLAERCLP